MKETYLELLRSQHLYDVAHDELDASRRRYSRFCVAWHKDPPLLWRPWGTDPTPFQLSRPHGNGNRPLLPDPGWTYTWPMRARPASACHAPAHSWLAAIDLVVALLWALLSFSLPAQAAEAAQVAEGTEIELFMREGCPHCEDAKAFLAELYKHVPVLDSGARGASTTFVQKRIGDVHLAWENEARLEVQEAKGGLEIVYPPISILAEPFVAVVDATVDRAKGHRAAAEAYLQYLYTDEGQNIIAKHYYRPSNAAVLQAHAADFPNIELFPITKIAP